LLLALGGAQAAIGCAASPPGASTGVNTDPKCQFDGKAEKSPGYPFDTAKFNSAVLPVLISSCGTGTACHQQPTGNGGLVVWTTAATNACDAAQTFNSAVKLVDLTTPANSQLTGAVTGAVTGHPVTLQATDAKLITLQSFITAAAAVQAADGGGVVAPPSNSVFDFAVFQTTIQPVFNAGGCAIVGCHGSGTGGFTLKAMATATADLQANFTAISTRANLTDPSTSIILRQATTLHGSGKSTQVSADGAAKLLAWITAAKNAAPPTGDASCAPVSSFNIGTFSSEILPILNGSLDLNQVNGNGRGAGCMSTQCHGGAVTGPGKLNLSGSDPASLLQSFACFVKLDAPTTSEILLCPTASFGCRVAVHPGQEVFNGAADLNYQRILAFIYGSGAVNPLDYAFFVRKINTLFDDVNVVQAGTTNQTCADTTACHGISVAGQAPPNNSDFPILANSSDDSRLSVNFVSATQFVTFLNPTESSLFLYPTNEIANRNAHAFATGIDHPGGLDFAANSNEAKLILQWAAGLRPDGQGFQHNWLVLGDFPALKVSDGTVINETTVNPKIFKADGGSFNLQQWDGFFPDSANVDLNIPFPKVGASRIAYASSFLLNTQGRTQVVQVKVVTNNPIQIYINGAIAAQNDASGGANAITTLAPSGAGSKAKVLIKLLQRATDAQFAFTAQLTDDQGIPLTDINGGIVVTLSDNGGI